MFFLMDFFYFFKQIFNSYIDLLYPTEDRIERLKDSYFFTCDCKECTSKSKVSTCFYTLYFKESEIVICYY